MEGITFFRYYFHLILDILIKIEPCLDRDRSKTLKNKYNVKIIPCLVVLSPTYEIITTDGANEIRVASTDAIREWSQGKRLFWSRAIREGEYAWKDVTCKQCFMSPLIGPRYGCGFRECQVNLCENCHQTATHEHPLLEYLIPKQNYTLEELLKHVPQLIDPKTDEKVQTNKLWENDVKTIGFYFSAHWCSPCREFTPKLSELYKEFKSTSDLFDIVFVSSDNDEKSFDEYRKEMPWLAVPLNFGAPIEVYFQFPGKQYTQ